MTIPVHQEQRQRINGAKSPVLNAPNYRAHGKLTFNFKFIAKFFSSYRKELSFLSLIFVSSSYSFSSILPFICNLLHLRPRTAGKFHTVRLSHQHQL
jgi:hypothetical protein